MKELIYVPIIHTGEDLGSLAKDIRKRSIRDLGERLWAQHNQTVAGFWDVVSDYFDSIEVSGMKIYQDGMVAEGEVGQNIVEEIAKKGSKNYELVLRLLKRGAILIKTELLNLVKEERDRLLLITQAKSTTKKIISFIKYRLIKDKLLNKRDKFIAETINESLSHGEKGILFIGAYHNIKNRLPKDIQVREIKDIERVRKYHRLLPFYDKHRKKFEELSKYLVLPIT